MARSYFDILPREIQEEARRFEEDARLRDSVKLHVIPAKITQGGGPIEIVTSKGSVGCYISITDFIEYLQGTTNQLECISFNDDGTGYLIGKYVINLSRRQTDVLREKLLAFWSDWRDDFPIWGELWY